MLWSAIVKTHLKETACIQPPTKASTRSRRNTRKVGWQLNQIASQHAGMKYVRQCQPKHRDDKWYHGEIAEVDCQINQALWHTKLRDWKSRNSFPQPKANYRYNFKPGPRPRELRLSNILEPSTHYKHQKNGKGLWDGSLISDAGRNKKIVIVMVV